MIIELEKGHAYMARIGLYWYVGHQTSERKYNFVCFSHVCDVKETSHICTTRVNDRFNEVVQVKNNTTLRKYMFEILQTGQLKGC